jgi:hypothetical protein
MEKEKNMLNFAVSHTQKRLFEIRFVKGKRGPDIFHAMGLTRRKLSKQKATFRRRKPFLVLGKSCR